MNTVVKHLVAAGLAGLVYLLSGLPFLVGIGFYALVFVCSVFGPAAYETWIVFRARRQIERARARRAA